MRSTVSLLRPRPGSFDEALAAFRGARIRACVAKLQGVESVAASLLRARALLRLGDPAAALVAVRNERSDDTRTRGELALLRAVAAARTGDDAMSLEAFVDAHVYGISSTDAALEAEVEFYEGLTAFGLGAVDDARAACLRGLDVAAAPPPPGPAGRTGFVPLAHVVSRLQELLGILDAAAGRHREQLVHVRGALATLDASAVPDRFQEAFAVRNLAVLVRDLDLKVDARNLTDRVASFAWTDDVAHVNFSAVESLAWCSALHGDVVEALRLIRRAEAVAAAIPERVIVGTDRATIAREHGHVPLLVEELENALDLTAGYDWDQAPGDTRLALLPLAQVAATVAPSKARDVLDRYTAIRNAMDPTFAARVELRIRAEEAYTHGIVLRGEGRNAASVERLRAAFDTWNAIGFAWRAARAALELTELDAGELFRTAVRRELRRRPQSLFATRARLVA